MTDVLDSELQEAERRIGWALDHPHVSSWLKDALREALACDPVAVANDVEILRELLRFRTGAIVHTALRIQPGTPDQRGRWKSI